MADVLVFSEQDSVVFELLSGARALSGSIAVAVLGTRDPSAFFAFGAGEAYVSQASQLEQYSAEVYAEALAQIARASNARTVLIGSTKRGKELSGRVAQKLECGAVTDAIGMSVRDGKLTVQRYALGGNTIATDMITTECQVIAVMPKTFEATQQPTEGKVITVALELLNPRVRVTERKPKAAATANLEDADTLVVVGKGFGKKEDLAIAEALAQALHAEIGCTRSLSSDYHWLGEDRMIGISGKKCKPRVMVSVGVSGQIQHTVGILGSKIIVAINKDKSAPIFKIADYGIIGDLYQVVPHLTAKIK